MVFNSIFYQNSFKKYNITGIETFIRGTILKSRITKLKQKREEHIHIAREKLF